MDKVVIGFVGKFGVGKGLAIDYLKNKHEFYASSCSDRIREEILRNNKEVTRENLQTTAGKLRKEFGSTVLAERTWKYIEESNNRKTVIDSIRSVEEVEYLKKQPNFYLISLDAPQRLRFERMVSRNNPGDPKTWEDFLQVEARDDNKDGRSIDEAMDLADSQIINEGSEEELYKSLDKILTKINY